MVDITRAGTYVITAKPPRGSDLDTYLELYDAAETLIDEDDDGGQSLDARLEVQLAAGRYYLKAWQVDPEIAGDGSYELAVDTP
jgi:hypothetical protein